jgi:hypothetical protein
MSTLPTKNKIKKEITRNIKKIKRNNKEHTKR